MGTHPIFESDFDCLTDIKIGKKMSKAKTAAKAALKGKNNLRKKKMRTCPFQETKDPQIGQKPKVPNQIIGCCTKTRPILNHQAPIDHGICHEENRRQQHPRLHRRYQGQQAKDQGCCQEDVRRKSKTTTPSSSSSISRPTSQRSRLLSRRCTKLKSPRFEPLHITIFRYSKI